MQIHQYKSNGLNIVMDIPSGAVHVVDDIVYDALALREEGKNRDEVKSALSEKYPPSDIDDALSEIDELIAQKMLYTDEPYRPAIETFGKRPTVTKALCLNVAHDCNLACKYCFAEEGEYHGRRALMDLETGKKAFDFLVAQSGHRRNLEVDFFGGEPLMNWDVVKQLVAYGHELEKTHDKHFRYTITTNGVLLNDEIMDFCNKEMKNVVMSIDGRKEVHDRMRPFRKGTGSYDLILPKIKKFCDEREKLGLEYYVRGTFTHWNLDFSKDVLDLADKGFKEISIEPVVAPPEEDYAIRPEDLPTILEQYDILLEEMIKRYKEGRPFNFYHFMIDLTGGPCVYKRLSGCGAGSEYLGVTPWGDFYPCHQFVGIDQFCLGNVNDGITRPDLVEEFKKVNVYSKDECSKCYSRFYCSGGCAANSFNFTGGINDVYDIGCQMQRKRIECAIALKAAIAEEDEKRANKGA